jgi:hypothetical protein
MTSRDHVACQDTTHPVYRQCWRKPARLTLVHQETNTAGGSKSEVEIKKLKIKNTLVCREGSAVGGSKSEVEIRGPGVAYQVALDLYIYIYIYTYTHKRTYI